ncbi:DUF397 domain-containing protein [Streptomyces sp. BH097]|uniref:DUF397 domain-containing protein n=1 Tax=unclassified Streptomyces TaxID=2593676 RepID=UPI003BB584A5
MGSTQDLANAQWRKSSYSGNTGGECIECATGTGTVAIRDSKDPGLGHFQVTPRAFRAFVAAVVGGQV